MTLNIDQEWDLYISSINDDKPTNPIDAVNEHIENIGNDNNTITVKSPKCSALNISTQTKVVFLSQAIDIYNIFWKIPILEYSTSETGVIKKQIKIVSHTPDEHKIIMDKLTGISYYTQNIIKQIDNPTARRIKFKDERKITVGLSRKDIINSRGKPKNAFYNCFAICLRFIHSGKYKEIHVKVFNTGKLEIPGIVNSTILDEVKTHILDVLQPLVNNPLTFVDTNGTGNVLINSNFTCGYTINRDKLQYIIRSSKYNIEAAFDPCSYPGVKCKYYYNNDDDPIKQTGSIDPTDMTMSMAELTTSNKYTIVSFMIFRTGSVLIVGNCSEEILTHIYNFITNVLETEYPEIFMPGSEIITKDKRTKIRKRTISLDNDYLNTHILSNGG
jgi:hypothetical protein